MEYYFVNFNKLKKKDVEVLCFALLFQEEEGNK